MVVVVVESEERSGESARIRRTGGMVSEPCPPAFVSHQSCVKYRKYKRKESTKHILVTIACMWKHERKRNNANK